VKRNDCLLIFWVYDSFAKGFSKIAFMASPHPSPAREGEIGIFENPFALSGKMQNCRTPDFLH
jgi:hypothetical protein